MVQNLSFILYFGKEPVRKLIIEQKRFIIKEKSIAFKIKKQTLSYAQMIKKIVPDSKIQQNYNVNKYSLFVYVLAVQCLLPSEEFGKKVSQQTASHCLCEVGFHANCPTVKALISQKGRNDTMALQTNVSTPEKWPREFLNNESNGSDGKQQVRFPKEIASQVCKRNKNQLSLEVYSVDGYKSLLRRGGTKCRASHFISIINLLQK